MKIFTKNSVITAVIVLSIFNVSTLRAQSSFQIPNSGFENIVQDNNNSNTGYRPVGWYSSNVHTTALGITARRAVVHPGSLTGVNMSDAWNQPTSNGNNPVLPHVAVQGRNGTECIYIHNEMAGAMGIESDSYAYISLGKPWNQVDGTLIPDATTARGGCEGGIDFNHRPDTMEVWIKRSWQIQENARLLIYLWSGEFKGTHYRSMSKGCLPSNRTNDEVDVRGTNSCTTSQRGTLVGEGQWVSTQQFSDWTLIKVPIRYFSNLPPEKVNIFISAANYPDEGNTQSVKAGARLWADDLRLVYSSKIHEVRVDVNGTFRPIPGFNENVYDYTYVVKPEVTTVPIIQMFRSGRQLSGSEISVVPGVIDSAPTVVTVTAEDGSSTSTYRIFFASTQSTNASPAGILVNGTPISGFNPNISSYNVALPYGTTGCPIITVQEAEGAQTWTVTPACPTIPGSATVKVFAQDVSVFKTYTLNLSIAPLNDNTLQDILINGVSIPNFRPTVNNYYNVELPLGTTQAPVIEAISAWPDGAQTIVITPGGLNGTTTIQVSVPNNPNLTARTYKITFVVVASSNAYLNDIKVGGVSIPYFEPERLTYNYLLPRGTTDLPDITCIKGEENQTVMPIFNGVNGETRITVTAHNGTTTRVYRINFSVERSEYPFLNDILLDGLSIPNFNPYTLEYDIELPSGTISLPEISYIDTLGQTVRVTTNGINGTTTIRVTAENPQFYIIYRLNFSVARSESSLLNGIVVQGYPLPEFLPEIFDYKYLLPSHATYCPTLDVIKGTEGQQVFISKPALTGIATIRVISELAGGGENIYTVNFQFDFSQSSNNLLEWIKLDGELLENFDSEQTSYLIEDWEPNRPAPVVECFASDSVAKVFMINNGLNGTIITVTAEDGSTLTYKINYTIKKTNNTNLTNIEVWDNTAQRFVSLPGFNAQTVKYNYILPWRTNPVPAINPVAAESGQVITVFYGAVNDTTEIQVVAPDRSNQKTYKIYFPVKKSSECALSSITVDGYELADLPPNVAFSPTRLNYYNITLPYGTTQPTIAFEKTVYEQQVKITAGNINEPYILKVIAEDSTTRTYTLTFSVDMSGKSGENAENYLENILVNDIPVENFNSQTLEYSVVLPYGTTKLPEISFIKRYPEQTVITDLSGVWGTSKITVFSNISGVAAKEYKINFSVSDVPVLKLDSILFNGEKLENFDPRVNSYIVSVSTASTPRVEYFYDYSTLYVNEDDTFDPSHHKKLVLTVVNQEETESNIYTFWYFYTNDTLPNPSFEEWGPAVYNSDRAGINAVSPIGWNTPADCEESISRLLQTTYYFGREVVKSAEGDATEGSFSALMYGFHTGNITNKFVPGILTLGKFVSTGNNTNNNHNTSVNGGINFRNTPDVFNFDYKWTRDDGSTNTGMRALVQLWNSGDNYNETQGVANSLYTGNSGEWLSVAQPITYTYFCPKRLNIILNSTDSENAVTRPTSIATTAKWGRLWADNVSFGYSPFLKNIYIDGVPVPDFNDTTTQYRMSIAAETMMPIITYDNAVPDQEVRFTLSDENANRERTLKIFSKAEDNLTTIEYTVTLTRHVSSDNTLKGIIINGIAVANFTTNIFEYNDVPLPKGMIYLPNILAIKGNGHQTVSYSLGDKRVSITVTAENESVQTYIVNFVESNSVSSDTTTTLLNLEVDGYDIEFDAQTTEYTVTLLSELQDIPSILFTKKRDGQMVTLTTCTINGTATIRVTAENRVDFTDYKIIFSRPVKTSLLLSEISVGNLSIGNFEQETFDYVVDFGKVIFTREFAEDVMSVVYSDNLIECFIGKNKENRYTVTFENSNLNNAYLANLFVNGISVNDNQTPSGVSPAQGARDETNLMPGTIITVSYEGETLPDVSVMSGAKGQTITHIWNESSIIITVTAQDGITQEEYIVNFVPAHQSDNAFLTDIIINGVSINGFVPANLTYNIELPEGTIVMPTISWILGEQHQIVDITHSGVDGTTTILVTAQNGTTTVPYTINFTVALSSNAFLSEIVVNDVLIDYFSSQRFYYEYQLPYGTTTLPNITYTPGHPNQDIQVQSNGVRGNYIITVTSENRQVVNRYIIAFSVVPSANAYLESILANNVEIDFEYDRFDYTLPVHCGSTVPTITWVANDYQTVVITNAENLNETTRLFVTSENGVNQNTYTISFVEQQSSNVLLADIIIGGESLKIAADGYTANVLFDEYIEEYCITLPYVITELPEITAIAQGTEYCSAISIETTDSTATINVVSQDNSENIYMLHFVSGYSKLKNIFINGTPVSAEGFNPNTLTYKRTYPVGTSVSELLSIEDITYILGEEHQIVAKSIDDDHTIVLRVLAQNQTFYTDYEIKQVISRSNNALLADIKINGKSLEGFNPMNFYYKYILEGGVSERPTFEGIAQEESQTIENIGNNIGEISIIIVTAEDGSENVYSILFESSTEIMTEPTARDVCWGFYGNDAVKFSSKKNNVSVIVFDINGQLVYRTNVSVSDPNEELCESVGAIFYAQKGRTYAFTFIYNDKKKIKGTDAKIMF